MLLDVTTYQAILGALSEGIVFADSDNRIVYLNPAIERIRGIKAGNFIGMDLLRIHSPTLREKITNLLSAFRSGEQLSHRHKAEIKGVLFENCYHAVLDKNGNYVGALMVCREYPDT